MYGLKPSTADIDIKVDEDYFKELQKKYMFKKSPKFPYLYELTSDIEVAVLNYNKEDVRIVDGYPVESLELTLKWMEEHNRPKDQEKMKIIREYLEKEGK